MKTIEDFQKAVKEHNISRWDIHDCGMCGYWCGFIFREGEVYYDSGCDCSYGGRPSQRDWEDVTEHYNMQDSPEYIKKMNDFWKFTD